MAFFLFLLLFLLSLQKCVSGHVLADNARRYAQRERAVTLIKKKKKTITKFSNITCIIKRWRVDSVKIFIMKKLWLRNDLFSFYRTIDGTNSWNFPSFRHTCVEHTFVIFANIFVLSAQIAHVYIDRGTMNEKKVQECSVLRRQRYRLDCWSYFIFKPSLYKRGYIAFIMIKECEASYNLFTFRRLSSSSSHLIHPVARSKRFREVIRESGDNDDASDSSHSMPIVPRTFTRYLYIF